MTQERLSPDKWIAAGLTALHESGPGALAAEPLARRIGTTKGSFYWHFKDVHAFHTALIADWRVQAITALQTAVSDTNTPDQRLRDFGAALLADQTETALRIWSHTNAEVAAALRAVDAERHTYLTLLLREMGLGNPDFARALQATLIGLPQMDGGQAPFETLVDTILALS